MKFVPYALALSLATGCATHSKSRTPSELKPYIQSLESQAAEGYSFPCENVMIKIVNGEPSQALARYVDATKLSDLRVRMGAFIRTAPQRFAEGVGEDVLNKESAALGKEANALFGDGKNYIYRNSGKDIDSDADDLAYDFSRGKRIPGPEFTQYLDGIGFCKPKEKK